MAKSFLSTASKKVTDIREYLRETAGGNSIKYVAEKGAKHMVYIPFINVQTIDEKGVETVKRQLVAISGKLHDWTSADGKYKAVCCLKDVIRKSDDDTVLLNDGSCPFCNRVDEGWDIYNYRKEQEEKACKLVGDDRKKHMESTLSDYADERKAKVARDYMYPLIVKYRTNGKDVIIGTNGLPEYDLKIMKLSSSRVEKLGQQIANAGAQLEGSEIMFEYPSTDDNRLLISQSTSAPVFPNNMLTVKYPALLEKINQDVEKFEWEGMEKSFPEWSGMTSVEAKKITDDMFEKWDEYKKAILVNPSAKYAEYIANVQVTNPEIGVGQAVNIPQIPQVPNIPGVPDVNDVFASGSSPMIQI